MLAEAGVLTGEERDAIIQGLDEIRAEIEAGEFEWSVALEDVHMNIEARLTDKIGITGKKLHPGRSRNDQVATDIRLWLRDEIEQPHLQRVKVATPPSYEDDDEVPEERYFELSLREDPEHPFPADARLVLEGGGLRTVQPLGEDAPRERDRCFVETIRVP